MLFHLLSYAKCRFPLPSVFSLILDTDIRNFSVSEKGGSNPWTLPPSSGSANANILKNLIHIYCIHAWLLLTFVNFATEKHPSVSINSRTNNSIFRWFLPLHWLFLDLLYFVWYISFRFVILHFVSFRFFIFHCISFRFISFRFVMFSFLSLVVPVYMYWFFTVLLKKIRNKTVQMTPISCRNSIDDPCWFYI